MSFAELLTPLKGRKSAMPRSAVHRNARLRPKPSRLVATTCPSRFTALAWLTAPPSVPSSRIATSGARARCWPTIRLARPRRAAARRTGARESRGDRSDSRRPCGRSTPRLRRGCTSGAAAPPPLRPPTRAGSPAARGRCSHPPTPAARPSRLSAVPAGPCGFPSLSIAVWRWLESLHHHVPLSALQQLGAQLPEDVAVYGLGAVGREPGRIVTGCAPSARVEGRPPIGDPKQREGRVPGGVQRIRIEARGAEQESHFGTGFLDVILQRLDLGAPECGLLPPAGDQRPPLPGRSAHYTFQFKEIAALGFGQRRAPMDTQLADVEADLSELAHDEDLKGLGCELRQFQRRHPLSSPSLSRGHYGTGAGAARPG